MIKGIRLKNIESYEYQISEKGDIYSIKMTTEGQKLIQRIDRAGYLTVRLSNNQSSKTHYLHRLLAQTFIPPIESKGHINHKNGIKTDNRVENLEWVSHSENIQHAYKTGLIQKDSISKKVKDIVSGVVYNSIKEASVALGIPYSTCKNYLCGNRANKTSLGYLN